MFGPRTFNDFLIRLIIEILQYLNNFVKCTNVECLPPELTKITEANTLKKGISSLRVEVELVGTNITHVYATVVLPTYDPTTESASWGLMSLI